MVVVSANLSNVVLLPRLGPKPLVPAGMLLAAASLVWLTKIGYRGAELTDRFTEVLERPASNSMIGWPSRCGPGLWQPGRSSLSGEPAVY